MMRIGLLADIHGNIAALQAVMRVLPYEVDDILFLGDLSGYYPFVNECVELLAEYAVRGVRGNHDQRLLDCVEDGKLPPDSYTSKYGSALARCLETLTRESCMYLTSLPLSYHSNIDGIDCAAYHGSPWEVLEGRIYPDYPEWQRFESIPEEMIFLGHTHYRLVRQHQQKLIVNPGSVGQARDRAGGACYGILRFPPEKPQHMVIPYDPSRILADAQQHDPHLPYLTEVLSR